MPEYNSQLIFNYYQVISHEILETPLVRVTQIINPSVMKAALIQVTLDIKVNIPYPNVILYMHIISDHNCRPTILNDKESASIS